MMDVIDEIVQRRRAAGLSQQELARRSGVKQPNLARIELRQTKPGWTPWKAYWPPSAVSWPCVKNKKPPHLLAQAARRRTVCQLRAWQSVPTVGLYHLPGRLSKHARRCF